MKRILVLGAMLLSGCANWGDFVIPSHENSANTNHDLLCVVPGHTKPQESGGAGILALAAGELIGWAYDGLISAGRVEAGRYSASTSGKTSTYVLKFVPDMPGFNYTPDVKLTPEANQAAELRALNAWLRLNVIQMDTIKLVRFVSISDEHHVKSTCEELKDLEVGELAGHHVNKAFELLLDVEYKIDSVPGVLTKGSTEQKTMARIVPHYLHVKSSKAKVPAMSAWRPWTWLLFTKPKYGTFDANVALTLEAFVLSGGVYGSQNIATLNFEFKGIELPEGAGVTIPHEKTIGSQTSEWFEVPPILRLASHGKDGLGRMTIKAKLTESNELGDVLGSEIDRAASRKQERVDSLLQKLK